MNQIAANWKAASIERVRPSAAQRLARRILLSRLKGLSRGRLEIRDAQGRWTFGAEDASLSARVEVSDPRFYTSLLLGGSVGAGESYMRGEWTSEDLTGLVRIMVLNRKLQGRMESGLAHLFKVLQSLHHWLHKNTVRGSRRNIAAHYDLGNDFFRLFLSSDMMYSCALYRSADDTLEEASRNKLDTICRKLELSPRDHLLEIGTGWGGMALHAARRYGCRVTTATISRRQYDWTVRRVRQAGLQDRIRVLLEDYRRLSGRFDKLVSIEMIEAVGHQYFDAYFEECSRLLKPEGMMLLQAITISDPFFNQAKRNVDFIKRYIFPGSCLPSVSAICDSLSRVTDLKLFHLDDITPHYARTLRDWRQRFFDHIEQVRRQGFPEQFVRMWEFYLCYCEAGFAERYIGDVQMLLTKPMCRRPALAGGPPGGTDIRP
ncbi:MAG TPA: cyclopropane-fatty-acyl-phospholipid synthase family protein [Acidobacteriota bacterium]|nr:cyclopropane-fatty-acyl-phospholipid synthase family protein [Acidobacteriota bacterium]